MSEEAQKRIVDLEQENTILKEATKQWDHIQRLLLESQEKLRQSEEFLREVKERMERSLGAGNLAWWDWEYKTGTMYYNPERARLLGYPPEELPRTFSEAVKQIHPEDYEEAIRQIHAHLAGEIPYYEAEVRLQTREGGWRWFYDRGKVIEKDILGEPVHVSGVLIDIDERKRAEKALTEARDLADAASRAKSLFLANMSHEIYTPLAGVVGMADILRQSDLTPEQSEYIDIIVNSASNLMSVLNDIMEFIKVENQKIELSFGPVSITQVVKDVTQPVLERCREKKLELLTFIDTHIPDFVIGDPKRLRQLLQILLSNAVKFTEEGRIIVSAEFAEWDDDSIRIRFRVSDTGIGIPEQDFERLFHSFTRLNTKIGKYGGSGLGLAIARHLVELMNGTISVESQEGKGSTFICTVEVDRLVEQETFTDTSVAKGKRVLLVDCDPVRRHILRDYLLIWDSEVEERESIPQAREAMAQAVHARKPFELLITDEAVIHPPGEPLSGILDPGEWKSSPAILVANQQEKTDRKEVQQAGFRVLLYNPYFPEQLLQAFTLSLLPDQPAFTVIGDPYDEWTPVEERKLLTILLAEDNLINQKVALVTLNKLGHHTDLAENGRQAVELFKANHYDLILMDVHMPEMDGVEATKKIREIEAERGSEPVPICAITANIHKEDEEKCYQAGMNSYITKPFKLQELNTVLARL